MKLDPSEYDADWNWIGTCPKCDTNHHGYIPGSIAAERACVRSQVARLTGPAAVFFRWLLARLDARLARKRDRVLRQHWDGR